MANYMAKTKKQTKESSFTEPVKRVYQIKEPRTKWKAVAVDNIRIAAEVLKNQENIAVQLDMVLNKNRALQERLLQAQNNSDMWRAKSEEYRNLYVQASRSFLRKCSDWLFG